MIAALMLDPDDSVDFAGNNGTAFGRPLAAYPLMAAKASRYIQKNYVVTDSPPVKAVALQYNAVIIDPPKTPAASPDHYAENLLRQGYDFIRKELQDEKQSLEFLIVFYAHTPTVTGDLLEQGIEALQAKPELDSAVSVSKYSRFNPFDARHLNGEGLLEPFVSQDSGAAVGAAETWYFDWSAQVLRPKFLESGGKGKAALWGKKIFPLKQWGGGPIDHQSQIPSLEFWLKKHGIPDLSPTREMQPKPQPQTAPKDRR